MERTGAGWGQEGSPKVGRVRSGLRNAGVKGGATVGLVMAGVFAGVDVEAAIGLVTAGAFAGTVGMGCAGAEDVLVVDATTLVVSGAEGLAELEPERVPGVPMRVVRVPGADGPGDGVGG
jgi:hypothetical protein